MVGAAQLKAIVAALVLAASLAACIPPGPTAATPAPHPTPTPIVLDPAQFRGLWVDAFHDGMKSRAQVERLVADVQRAHLNAVFVQVRKAGDAYFNLADEPRATDISGPKSFDPLAYLIELAHASNPRIDVHAWLNTFFVGKASQVLKQHPDWANVTDDGTTGGYLDPGIPEVRMYTQRIFVNVARRYNVDGIHMDFVRYPGANWGYSSSALAIYEMKSGSTTPPDPADEAFKAWRRDNVTAFVHELHAALARARSAVKLSGALICFGAGPASTSAAAWNRTSAHAGVYQDWAVWMANGYLDFGVPMNYDSDWSRVERGWFDQWLDFEKNSPWGGRIVTGVGVFLNYPEGGLAQLTRALGPSTRGNRVLGIAIYSYGSTSVYGTDDFFTDPDTASGLPRQPYDDGITDPDVLAQRAATFNDWFWTQLSQPDFYRDVVQGWVATSPIFTQAAPVPAIPTD